MAQVVCAQLGMGISPDQVAANFRLEIAPAYYEPTSAEVSAVIRYGRVTFCPG
jgi:hypothetical protein